MKTPYDPRHRRRQRTMKALFAYSFDRNEVKPGLIKDIIEKLPVIDDVISKIAPEFPIQEMNRVDLAILRLAIFELLEKKEPPKVIIDEAIELAKEFGGQRSPAFINGALANMLKNENPTL